MNWRLLLLSSVALLLVALWAIEVRSQPEQVRDPAENVRTFMRVKLLQSQRVLEGLTMEDYDAIAKHSQEMSLLSQAATWQVLQTPEYRDRSTEFRRAADALTEAAKNRNLDGAALAYVDVTMKCIDCHKYVRRVRTASLESPNSPNF
jgi:hypothetical protein